MSSRAGALACGLLLAISACSRAPPIQAPAAQTADAAPASDSEPIVLAGAPTGGPDQDASPAAKADAAPPPPNPTAIALSPSDPLEPVNRRLYAVDMAVSHAIQKRPKIGSIETPRTRGVIRAAQNALENLDEPSTAANDLLQRKLFKAGRTTVRFVLNSTVGVVGLFDVASNLGFERRHNDLDRTLAMYGAPPGPYFYVPIAGPATLRGVVAMVAEGYLYPPHWFHLAAGVGPALQGAKYVRLAATAVKRADGTPGQNGDAYSRTRSAYYASVASPVPGRAPEGAPRPTALASLAGGE
jgi:phospholipid-binding lipoprotein MlaA